MADENSNETLVAKLYGEDNEARGEAISQILFKAECYARNLHNSLAGINAKFTYNPDLYAAEALAHDLVTWMETTRAVLLEAAPKAEGAKPNEKKSEAPKVVLH